MKRFFNQSVLIDLIFIISYPFLRKTQIINSMTDDYIGTLLLNIMAVTTIVYGILLILSFVIASETRYGESKIFSLLFGVIFTIIGALIYVYNIESNKILNIWSYIVCGLALIHGIGRCLINHKNIILKIFGLLNGILYIGFAIILLNFIKIDIYDKILCGLIIAIIDLIIWIVQIILPKEDLENRDVEIKVGSPEDRIYMEPTIKVKKHKKDIDLSTFFKEK